MQNPEAIALMFGEHEIQPTDTALVVRNARHASVVGAWLIQMVAQLWMIGGDMLDDDNTLVSNIQQFNIDNNHHQH